MTERDLPAFPCVVKSDENCQLWYPGMSLRDWFAGMAMQGMVAAEGGLSNRFIGKEAYALADAMLKARSKPGEEE